MKNTFLKKISILALFGVSVFGLSNVFAQQENNVNPGTGYQNSNPNSSANPDQSTSSNQFNNPNSANPAVNPSMNPTLNPNAFPPDQNAGPNSTTTNPNNQQQNYENPQNNNNTNPPGYAPTNNQPAGANTNSGSPTP